jgi:hypothetical protein
MQGLLHGNTAIVIHDVVGRPCYSLLFGFFAWWSLPLFIGNYDAALHDMEELLA